MYLVFRIIQRLAVIVILLLIGFTSLFANPQRDFQAANEAYQEGNYGAAIQGYERILSEGNSSNEIYYNLGNAYFKSAIIGKAILNYERALLSRPNDGDTKFNLEIAQTRLEDDLETIGTFFLIEWWQNIHKLFSSAVWGVLTLISLWGGIAGLLLWLLGRTRDLKKQGFISGIGLLLVSTLLFFIGNSQANFEQNSQFAIILDKEVNLRSAPDEESNSILEIHEGLKVGLLDEIGTWQKVKLSNGDQGWLPKASFEEI